VTVKETLIGICDVISLSPDGINQTKLS